jgi:hypothetical protein
VSLLAFSMSRNRQRVGAQHCTATNKNGTRAAMFND